MEDAIRLVNISKSFGRIQANKDVCLTVRRGEVLALLGENGSGKTTLMNMLSGIYFPDSGQIYVDGREVSIRSPKDAHDLGIGMIHQHFKLVDVFTAAENTVLGLPGHERLNLKQAGEKIRAICDRYGFELDPEQKVYDMTVSQKQTLEIVKMLFRGTDILILDEPTAVLTPQETQKLFSVIREMKKDGKSIIIITHKLNEVLAVSDRVTILRKGLYVDTVETAQATELSLTEMMVGKKVSLDIERPVVENKIRRIKVSHLSVMGPEGVPALKDVSFDLYGGEILGIAGISGCGQKELLESIAGLQITSDGTSILYYAPGEEDKPYELTGRTPRAIKELGVHLSFVPEDRLGMGLVASMGMTGNMMLKTYEDGGSVFVEQKAPRELAETIRDDLSVVTPGINTPVRSLSGGNVQKVLVGREISAAPAVLMTAYAVRGLDIGTSYQIYHLLNEQKQKGVAVLYVGEDLDVLIDLCDRILVLCAGQLTGILKGSEATKEQIGLMMTKTDHKHGGEGGEKHEN